MKKWLKLCLILLAIVGISIGVYFILRACGITDVEQLREIIASCGAWGWIVFIALFTLSTSLLCFVPGISMTFITVSIILFGAWKGFLISSISVFISSSIMFVIGNTVGERAAVKLVGKESLEKAQNLIDVKSKLLLPLMLLFPVFPDDALCLVAGMTKMKYWYFAIIALICRTVGIATICFLGSGFIDWATLSLVDWFVLINIVVFDIVLIFKYQSKIENFILRKKKKEEPAEQTEIEEPKSFNYTAKIDRMILQRHEFEKAIAKRQEIIQSKRYRSEDQLKAVQKKIKNIERAKTLLEKNLHKELRKEGITLQEEKVVEDDNSKEQLQDIICEEITKTMEKYFPKVKYGITRSSSTVSVYLNLFNDNGVKKTIRFSNHDSKVIGRHNMEEVISSKAFKRIIEKNLKILNKKTVYVLLDKVSKERETKENA